MTGIDVADIMEEVCLYNEIDDEMKYAGRSFLREETPSVAGLFCC